MTLKSSSYLLPKFSRVPLTIVLIPLISTVVNGTLLNFGKRYEDNFKRVNFDQWPKLHLGLDALSNQKNLDRYLVFTRHEIKNGANLNATKRCNFMLLRKTEKKTFAQ